MDKNAKYFVMSTPSEDGCCIVYGAFFSAGEAKRYISAMDSNPTFNRVFIAVVDE